MPPRVLRLRAYHIATFTPSNDEDGFDVTGAPFCLDAGATLQQARPCIHAPRSFPRSSRRRLTRGPQLLAAAGDAWSRTASSPLSSAVREAFTVTGERIRRVSQLRDGDAVVLSTYVDLRPLLSAELEKARSQCCLSRAPCCC